ncbi:MAG: disulfide oxidoreductase [Planctomycetes bacterium]|nr:disulfide oxidoreductase [Planctomycetota bacterium]
MTAENPPTTAPKARFTREMTVGEAQKVHPQVGQVFASFHIGGCSHCSVPESATLEQIGTQYGIPVEFLLSSLNGLPVI